jgi:hypothetical protein
MGSGFNANGSSQPPARALAGLAAQLVALAAAAARSLGDQRELGGGRRAAAAGARRRRAGAAAAAAAAAARRTPRIPRRARGAHRTFHNLPLSLLYG